MIKYQRYADRIEAPFVRKISHPVKDRKMFDRILKMILHVYLLQRRAQIGTFSTSEITIRNHQKRLRIADNKTTRVSKLFMREKGATT